MSAAAFTEALVRADWDPEAAAQAVEMLACVREPILPVDAVLFHRVAALDAHDRGQRAQALAHARAAFAADPSWNPPAALASEWREAMFFASRAVVATDPGAWVDGVRGAPLYLDRAAIVQLEVPDGRVTRLLVGTDLVVDTVIHRGDPAGPVIAPAEVPGAPVSLPPVAAVAAREPPVQSSAAAVPGGQTIPAKGFFERTPASTWFLAGGGALVLSAVGWGLGVGLVSDFKDPENPDITTRAELRELGTTADISLAASGVLGITGAGLMTAGVVRVYW